MADDDDKPRPRGRYGEAREDELAARVDRALRIVRPDEISLPLETDPSGHPSGMLERFVEEHFDRESVRSFKDQSRAPYNATGVEDTKLWGDTVAFSYNLPAGSATISLGTALKVFRSRPTTFTLTYTLALVSPIWATEAGNSTITVVWQIGVGLTRTFLARPITFVGTTSFIDGKATSISDTINVPAMNITASATLAGVNNQHPGQEHVALLTVLASPFVQ